MASVIQFSSFPSHWEVLPFSEAIKDKTGGNPKVKKRDVSAKGKIPVIDQGQDFIGGYTDDKQMICKENTPVILFGDHTKIFKYVDQNFALGADGVKVLCPIGGFDLRFLFHFLQTIKLPENAGYSRHFKYLKEVLIPKPPLSEQKHIASILDEVTHLKIKREETIHLADDFLRSVFLDMFGDPVTNPMKWDIVKFEKCLAAPLRNGLSPSNNGDVDGKVFTLSCVTRGKFNSSAQKVCKFNAKPDSSKYAQKNDLLICRGNGNLSLVGAGRFPDIDQTDITFPDTIIGAKINTNVVTREYIEFLWNSRKVRHYIESNARTTNGTHKINQTVIKSAEIPVPPKGLQEAYSQKVEEIKKNVREAESSLKDIETLFASLSQRAFSGNL